MFVQKRTISLLDAIRDTILIQMIIFAMFYKGFGSFWGPRGSAGGRRGAPVGGVWGV